jgi:hypothetical protein
MNWEAIGAIGEILGAIGVIVTLGYLAVQIRQNTRSLRAAAQQSFVEVNASFAGLLLNNDGMARVYRLGINDQSQPSEDELVQFDMLMVTFFRDAQNLLLQQGTMDHEMWEGTMRNVLWHMRQPGVLDWWKTRKRMFSSRFCEYLEAGGKGTAG